MANTVVVTNPVNSKGIELLQEHFNVIKLTEIQEDEELLDSLCGILVRSYKIPEFVYEKAKNLKVISKHGVGVERINLELATRNNIFVCNTPGTNSNAVAEFTLGQILALSKKICFSCFELKKGNNKYKTQMTGSGDLGIELEGKVLGIMGLGQIGRNVAQKANAGFGMKIIGFDPYISTSQIEGIPVEIVKTKEEILSRSDFISIHIPFNDKTKDFLSYDEFNQMKKCSFLVNTSRGGIVNEEALCYALDNGLIRGAASDVFLEEPVKPDHPLLSRSNFIGTHHIASQCRETMEKLAVAAAQNIIDVTKGKIPWSVVNKELLTRY
jgi:D-3-phosphoglycerate dehydrogenase